MEKVVQKEDTKNTFSKSIMGIILFLYLIGALLGTGLVIFAAIVNAKQGTALDSAMFIAYAAYVGGPTATSIGFYAWKSKAENVMKICQGAKADTSVEVMDILSKIEGGI